MHTTQDTKKNGNHLNVRLERRQQFSRFLCLRQTTLKYYNLVNKATGDRKTCVKKEAEFVCSLGE